MLTINHAHYSTIREQLVLSLRVLRLTRQMKLENIFPSHLISKRHTFPLGETVPAQKKKWLL